MPTLARLIYQRTKTKRKKVSSIVDKQKTKQSNIPTSQELMLLHRTFTMTMIKDHNLPIEKHRVVDVVV